MAIGMILPALLAGGASFGGVKMAGLGHVGAAASTSAAHGHGAAKPPGPTMSLEPFVLTVPDGTKKSHGVKCTLAIEFAKEVKEEELKPLIPRVRDSVLSYLRTLPYEQLAEHGLDEKARNEILDRLLEAGAGEAERVLITDFVMQ